MRRILLIVLAGFTLASCATPYRWTKTGASEVEVQAARNDCRQEAGSYTFLDWSPGLHIRTTTVPTIRGDRYASLTGETARREADLYNICMYEKGFRSVPEKSKPGENSGAENPNVKSTPAKSDS